ncbi:MAG TPA: hypothetical protein VHB25_13335 [Gemmatimonadaceae bacterium]|nr:hypothetical protein [Gemmatimonadaceae bacterium]
MSRLAFAALASVVVSGAAAAQQVPGRDLLQFPIGLLAEPAPLSNQMGGGFWNPATAALGSDTTARLGFAGLNTPQDQGVRLELAAGAYRVRSSTTVSLSVVQASVSDIVRTETDPESRGSEIPYGTTVLSAGVAQRKSFLQVGVAARYRWAIADNEHAGSFALDGGVVADRLGRVPIRVALSTFLFTPNRGADAATYAAAAELPLVKRDSTFALNAGYSASHTEGRGREGYGFASLRFAQLEANGGVAETHAYGGTDHRWRFGVGLHYAGYTVAIGREDGAAGFGASTQFFLTRAFR